MKIRYEFFLFFIFIFERLGRMHENKKNNLMSWWKPGILIPDLYLYSIKIQTDIDQNTVKNIWENHKYIFLKYFLEFLFFSSWAQPGPCGGAGPSWFLLASVHEQFTHACYSHGVINLQVHNVYALSAKLEKFTWKQRRQQHALDLYLLLFVCFSSGSSFFLFLFAVSLVFFFPVPWCSWRRSWRLVMKTMTGNASLCVFVFLFPSPLLCVSLSVLFFCFFLLCSLCFLAHFLLLVFSCLARSAPLFFFLLSRCFHPLLPSSSLHLPLLFYFSLISLLFFLFSPPSLV